MNRFIVGKTYKVTHNGEVGGYLKVHARVNIEGKDWAVIRYRDPEFHRRTKVVLILNYTREANSEALEFGNKDDKFLCIAGWENEAMNEAR